MKKNIYIKVLLLFAFSSSYTFSQSNKFHGNFDTYSTQNGLSQNDVRCIFQDSYGFIWIGTYGGINRFDGYSFITYDLDVNNNSISSNLISVITEDAQGNLWIGTDDRGVMVFDRDTEEFFQISNTKENPRLLTDNHIVSMLIDPEHVVWVGTINGLNRITFDHQSKDLDIEHLYVAKNEDSYAQNTIHSIFQDQLGNLWFGAGNGLNRYISSGKSHQFLRYQKNNNTAVRHIASNDTSLLIAYQNELSSLPFRNINDNNPGFQTIAIYSFTKTISDQRGTIWGINWSGVHLIYKENGRTISQNVVSDWSNPLSLSRDNSTSIYEDRSGIIWIGTNGGGVNLYNPNRKEFRHIDKNNTDGSISDSKIRAIKEDSKGNLWIGTEGGGLNLLPGTKGKDYQSGFKTFVVNSNVENYIFTIEEGVFKNRTRIFAGGGYGSNLYIYDYYDEDNIEKVDIGPITVNSAVFSLKQDSDGALWAGTYNNGLYRIKFNENGEYLGHVNFIHDPDNPQSISSNVIRSIEEDHDGNLWVGTDGGVNKVIKSQYDSIPPVFINYRNDPEDETSLSYDYVLPIFVASDNMIWVGTLGGGLNKLVKGEGLDDVKFLRINTKDGLPNDVIKSIEEDDQGNLWIGSNKGLSRYNPTSGEITNYGIGDGLQDVEFTEIASERRADGEMVFGGVKGLNTFFPKQISQDTSETKVVFTEMQVLNRAINTGKKYGGRVILKSNINDIEKIRLKHNENSFSISFAALNFAEPASNLYKYKLEGFDQEWINTSSQNRIAKYTNLAAGDYILKVQASNSDGFWSDNPIELAITINPPFWKSNVAFLIYGALFIVALVFIRKYSLITNEKKKNLLIEHLEKEKTEELSQLKLQFFMNISHEFRTPLTLILGLIERLKKAPSAFNEIERSKYYQKIYRNAQILLNLINQLLDLRKVEQGKMKIQVIHGNLGSYVEGLHENFNELARQKNIDFNFICDQNIEGYYDRDIIERIMFNLLSNAFKFTDPEGAITTSLELDGSDNVKLEVSDTGIGISNKIREQLFERFSESHHKREHGSGIGLSYTKALVELYHGSISFQSTENVGTTFTVEFPYTKEKFVNDTFLEDKETDYAEINKDVNWLLDLEANDAGSDDQLNKKKDHSILFVEDNDDILYYLSEQFQNKYNIFTASNGKEGLDLCLRENIDLVVSDVMMPEMDGLELCERLKKDDRINHIPIILLTAKKSSDNKLRGYEKGADAYIAKPFNIVEVETRMESLISSRQKILTKLRKNMSYEPSEIEVTSLDEKFLKRVVSYIEENIDMTEFTVDMLAKECGMSQLHLNKKLKILVGKTANVLIRSIRLKRAAQLLAKNRYSVNEVMHEVGFIDPKYFRICFKKEFGVPPSEYQKSHAEAE